MTNELSLLQLTNLKNHSETVDNIEQLQQDSFKTKYLKLNPSEPLNCKLPILNEANLSGEHLFFGKNVTDFNPNFQLAPTYLTAFTHCRLISNALVIVTNDNYVIEESYYADYILNKTGLFLKNNLKINLEGQTKAITFVLYKELSSKQIESDCILPIYYWHFNYHHWLIECLPRLRMALESPEFKDCKIIVPAQLSSFQKETLELMEIAESRLLYFDNSDWQIKKLYLPSLGNFSPDELSWIKDYFFKKLNIQAKADKLYYISRNDAHERNLINETEVTDYLKTQGFEILTLTGMSLQKQIEIFSQAKVIMGPHGAGLTNTIFASSEATLIEFIPNDTVNHCFWLLANSMGQKYSFLDGQKVNEKRDFTISLDKLKILLKDII